MAALTIQWLGFSCLRIQAKVEDEEAVLLTDPFAPAGNVKMPRSTEADLLLLSRDGANEEAVGGTPFIIRGPGEYEVRKIFIYGIPSGKDVLYRIEAGDLSLAYLGAARSLPETDVLARMEGVDVLLVPVGGGPTALTPKDAAKVVEAVEPRIVLPICFAPKGSGLELGGADAFFREVGASGEQIDKLKLQPKDLPQDQTVFYELTLS